MASINRVTILGNLGQDPEVRTFSSGGRVCNFSVATSERWKDKNSGEQRERTEWHRVSIYVDFMIDIAQESLSKGARVYVEGQLETRKWQDKSGNDRWTTEVCIRPYRGMIAPIVGRGGRSGEGGGGGSPPPSAGQVNDLDDEIPF